MNLQKDLREFVELLSALDVHFLVVGQLGVAPNRIDIMTRISGVAFEEAWESREFGEIGSLRIPFISREMLKRNKAASGRTQDLADLEHL